MIRSVIAGVVGLVAAFVVVVLLESASSALYPPPQGLDPTDMEALARHISMLPVGAFLFVLVAWTLGALLGTFTAARLTKPASRRPALVVAVLFFASCAFNLIAIPHPIWFWIAALVLVPAASAVGTQLGLRRKSAA